MPYVPTLSRNGAAPISPPSCGTTPVLKAAWRHLSAAEIALIPQSFASQIDIGRVRLIDRAHNPLAIGRILCRGHDIYWKAYPEDFCKQSVAMQALLIHELCHVWQYTHGTLTALRYLCNPRAWKYGYEFEPSKPFTAYPTEQQADFLQDWYAVNCAKQPHRYCQSVTAPSAEQINAVIPFAFDPIVTPQNTSPQSASPQSAAKARPARGIS